MFIKNMKSFLDTKFERVDWLATQTYVCGSNSGRVLII